MISLLTLVIGVLILVGAGFWTIFQQKHKAAKETVDSDKRMQVQYQLRTERNTASNLAVFFAAAIFAIIIVFALGGEYKVTKTNQREKEIKFQQDTIEDENSIIE